MSNNLLEVVNTLTTEELVIIGSSVHSAKIKKGLAIEDAVLDLLVQSGYNAEEGRVIIFSNVPENYSQKSYKPDIFVKTINEIWIVDAKGPAWNNNTPVSDTLKKYILAKKEIQDKTEKKVRLILLKNIEDDYIFNRLKSKSIEYGIEIIRSNPFLSEISKRDINIDKMFEEFLRKNIIDKIKNRIQ
jgi:hypothetical protein